ncbi:hypothetical protein V8G54_028205 [Vigna mungo]|uniref:Uncharacterized protein n=1 Tax=Vigna mungo TaxID=3915 RepID=A0AAQ3MR17_VIGMU
MEKNEMVEENCVLKSQIEKLTGEIQPRVVQCGHNLMNPFPQPEKIIEFSGENLQLSSTEAAMQQRHAIFLSLFKIVMIMFECTYFLLQIIKKMYSLHLLIMKFEVKNNQCVIFGVHYDRVE